MSDSPITRLAAILARFTHPALSRVADELGAFEVVLPSFSPSLELLSPGRLELAEHLPLGEVTVLALPDARPEIYARFLAAALLMGNPLLASPLSRMHHLIAERMREALPGEVRFAGEPSISGPAPTPGSLVMLGADGFSFDGGPLTEYRDDPAFRRTLCRRYSRQHRETVAVRSSLVVPRRIEAIIAEWRSASEDSPAAASVAA
jgi:hypothetical protein